MTFTTLVYKTDGPIATITLNRPDATQHHRSADARGVRTAINLAVKDPSVKVIILRGAGRSFCAGYDFGGGFHLWDEYITTERGVGRGQGLCLVDGADAWRRRKSS